MDVTPLVRKGQQIIQVYAGGTFKISGQSYSHAVIVTPDATHKWDVDENKTLGDLSFSDFEPLLDYTDRIDVFLLGCGKTMNFLDPSLKKELKMRKFHLEVMDTGAACRTYNVLMAEGRRVAAVLLPA